MHRRRDGRWEDQRGRDRYSSNSEYMDRRPRNSRRPPLAWVPPVVRDTPSSVPPSTSSPDDSSKGTREGRGEDQLLLTQQPSIITAASSSCSVSVPANIPRNEEHHHADHIGKVTPDLMNDDESSEQQSSIHKRKRDDDSSCFVPPDIVRASTTHPHPYTIGVLSPASSPMIHATSHHHHSTTANYHDTTMMVVSKAPLFDRETSVEEGEIPSSPTRTTNLGATADTIQRKPKRKKKKITIDDEEFAPQPATATGWSHDRDGAAPADRITTGKSKNEKDVPRKKKPTSKSPPRINQDRDATIERPKKLGVSALARPTKQPAAQVPAKTADGRPKPPPKKPTGRNASEAERPKKSKKVALADKRTDEERNNFVPSTGAKPKQIPSDSVTRHQKEARPKAKSAKKSAVSKLKISLDAAEERTFANQGAARVEVQSKPTTSAIKMRKKKQRAPSSDVDATAVVPYDSSWVAESMVAPHDSDSDTDEEELLVWAHHKLGVYIPNRAEVDRKRREKRKQRRRARREAAAKERKEQAKPLTQAQVAAFLAADEANGDTSGTSWVRRSMRQPSRSALQAPGVKELIAKLGSNDPDMVVLKMKKYCSDCDTPQIVIDSILDALEENTNCEALYIQNFNEGMRDEQMLHLLRILRNSRCKIWCLNIGETYNVSPEMWERFARGLKKTKVTHMYASEHVISAELKDKIRETIRKNRQKHTMHCDPENLDTIVRCTHCWWNPINTKSLRSHVRRYEHILKDADAQGLRGTTTGATLK